MPATPHAPLFAFTRTVLDEVESQTERLYAYGTGQMKDFADLGRTIRGQAAAVTRTMLTTVEQLADEGWRAMESMTKPFGAFVSPIVAQAQAAAAAATTKAAEAAKGAQK
jgi:hypothetical protein